MSCSQWFVLSRRDSEACCNSGKVCTQLNLPTAPTSLAQDQEWLSNYDSEDTCDCKMTIPQSTVNPLQEGWLLFQGPPLPMGSVSIMGSLGTQAEKMTLPTAWSCHGFGVHVHLLRFDFLLRNAVMRKWLRVCLAPSGSPQPLLLGHWLCPGCHGRMSLKHLLSSLETFPRDVWLE